MSELARSLDAGRDAPDITRVRHEIKRRELQVIRIERYEPQMLRVVLSGPELQGFTSLGFDDHIKLIFGEQMRDFTPRFFDARANELWVDFFLHDAGPAASWAAQAQVGQTLQIAGPKGSAVIALDGIDAHVLIGDETAVPAIARRLEELPAGTRALVVIGTEDGAAVPAFATAADARFVWTKRDELLTTLRGLEFPRGRAFAWVAGETQSARAIRACLRDERGIDKRWIKAAGYWRRGSAGAHERIEDDV